MKHVQPINWSTCCLQLNQQWRRGTRVLSILEAWAVKWQMKLNVDKCTVVHHGEKSISFTYGMYGQPLEAVISEKDTGN